MNPAPHALLITALAVTVAISGCGRKEQPPITLGQQEIRDIESVVFSLEQPWNEAHALATTHPDAPGRWLAIGQLRGVEQDVTIEEYKVLSVNSHEAVVRYTATVLHPAGSDFADHRITVLQTLKPHDGQWMLYTAETEQLAYLKHSDRDPG